ncbi:putative quinol monooxygenase [soil metagenome]
MSTQHLPASGPVSLLAEFTALPGTRSEVAALVARLVDDVRAEPGNMVFDAWVQTDEPDRWLVVEMYRDKQAFEAHLAAPHCHAFNRAIVGLVHGDGSQLTWLSPSPAA